MSHYAEQLRALGEHPVVQVAPCPEPHYAYVHQVNASQPLEPHELATMGAAAVTGTHPLVNHGNSILPNVRVYLVYLGEMWFDVPRNERFLQALVEDGYLDPLAPFGIGRGRFMGGIQGPATPAAITDADIQAIYRQMQAAGTLPAGDGNTLVMFCTAQGVSIDLGGQSYNCERWCGYHSALDGTTFYSVQPCTLCAGCNQGDAFAAFTQVESHELNEAVSDAFPGKGYTVDAPGDPYNDWETGDMAAWPDPVPTYAGEAIQGIWTGSRAEWGAYQAPAPAEPQQPFLASLDFWQWLAENYPQLLDRLMELDPDPAHQAVIRSWQAWLRTNKYAA